MAQAPLQLLLERFAAHRDSLAIIWHDTSYNYGWLLNAIDQGRLWIRQQAVQAGTVVFLEGDYSPASVAMLLALWMEQMIVVPFSQSSTVQRQHFISVSQAEVVITVGDPSALYYTQHVASHPLYDSLKAKGHAGLVLLTSGTSGPSKGVVHDVSRFLAKVERMTPRHQRVLAFLILDHLGGLDTLIYSLATIGCLVVPVDRTPDGILATIERYAVEVLPTSPSFLNLILVSGAYERHHLDSLKKISYGSEPMPQEVLRRYHAIVPHAKLTQTYGISEVGVMRTASESSDSLWMHVGGNDCETRVVDGVLQVRSPDMMLGYLNAPSPFTPDGWFITGDLVDASNGYIRIKGRASDIINVGGQKVYPSEVEEVIRQLPGVVDALVYGESNPLLGQIVCTNVMVQELTQPNLKENIRLHCAQALPKYKVPVRIEITTDSLTTERHKKQRPKKQ